MFLISIRQGQWACVSPRKKEVFLKKYKTKRFESYGVVKKDWATVPDSLLKNTKELKKYLQISYQHVQTLKPK